MQPRWRSRAPPVRLRTSSPQQVPRPSGGTKVASASLNHVGRGPQDRSRSPLPRRDFGFTSYGCSSVGRAVRSGRTGREFKPRHPYHSLTGRRPGGWSLKPAGLSSTLRPSTIIAASMGCCIGSYPIARGFDYLRRDHFVIHAARVRVVGRCLAKAKVRIRLPLAAPFWVLGESVVPSRLLASQSSIRAKAQRHMP